MQFVCPYCQSHIQPGSYCPVCASKVDSFYKIWSMSAFYYNQGLSAAQNRELSLAVTYLNKAILLYKYHIEARNLLGLIYLEIGQVADALKEWIVSQSLEKKDNKATEYIEQIQENPKYLATCKESIGLYNKGLKYLKQGNIDVAIIRLKKAIRLQPQLVEARVLLALAYMKELQYTKANEQVNKALSIDRTHKAALTYFKALSTEDTDSVAPYERDYTYKSEKQTNVHKMMNRTTYTRKYILYFVLGALAIFVINRWLVLPSEVERYENEIALLTEDQKNLSKELQNISKEYEIKVTDLESENRTLQDKVSIYEEEMLDVKQKVKLAEVNKLVEAREYEQAANTIYSIVATRLNDEELETLTTLKGMVYPKTVERLYNEGVSFYNKGSYVEAIADFEVLLQYEPDDWTARKTLYYLAQIYETTENMNEARKYYNKLLADYPETREAYEAEIKIEKLK